MNMKKKLSTEHKKKIAKSMTGKKRPVTFRKKNSLNNRGSKNTWAVLDEEKVLMIREMKEDGCKAGELAIDFHVSIQTIYKILQGKTWKHIL